jgi:hypothetical protein
VLPDYDTKPDSIYDVIETLVPTSAFDKPRLLEARVCACVAYASLPPDAVRVRGAQLWAPRARVRPGWLSLLDTANRPPEQVAALQSECANSKKLHSVTRAMTSLHTANEHARVAPSSIVN